MIIKCVRAFVCLLTFVPGAAFAQGVAAKDKSGEEQIVKMTEEVLAAEVHGDFATLDRFLTENYSHNHAVGLVESKSEYVGALKSGLHKYKSADLSQIRVRLFGGSAIISGQELIDGSRPYVFTAFWVEEQGRWRMAAWIANPVPKAPGAPSATH